MILKTGIDIIEIERIRAAFDRHGERFLTRIFTPAELKYCAGRVESLAVRFAAKEAVSKALGTGIGPVSWQEIEIRGGEYEAPAIILHDRVERIAKKLRLAHWSVSLSHSGTHAIALVVALGEDKW